jgi:histidinol-phosphate aminotransferase
MKAINKLVRPCILSLKPYSSARDEYSGSAAVYLDANENPFNSPYNRYPDPHQRELKKAIGASLGVSANEIFLGNGSDEAIDLLIRAFCEPGTDEIISMDPTYGMYQVAANINNVAFKKVKLNPDFSLNENEILKAVTSDTKLIFLCSPNNPTANSLAASSIVAILNGFDGLVILDEAYIDFSGSEGFLRNISSYPNLVILRTFSKAWGLAGIRLGMAFASETLIGILEKIKYPYNLNFLTQNIALNAINEEGRRSEWIATILRERDKLIQSLSDFDWVYTIYPSDANFLLVKVKGPDEIYKWLVENSIIIRNRSTVTLCEGCLRITVGSPNENAQLINSLTTYTQR